MSTFEYMLYTITLHDNVSLKCPR